MKMTKCDLCNKVYTGDVDYVGNPRVEKDKPIWNKISITINGSTSRQIDVCPKCSKEKGFPTNVVYTTSQDVFLDAMRDFISDEVTDAVDNMRP